MMPNGHRRSAPAAVLGQVAFPGLDPGRKPVFRKDHAPLTSMIRKSENRFSEKIMLHHKIKTPINSTEANALSSQV
jgi:hypothetical protein